MNYAVIKYNDISNGPGIRTSLFVSGCRNHCPGCFNPETWDFNYGKEFTEETKKLIFDSMTDYVDGITILGGEPLDEDNIDEVMNFIREFHIVFPEKTIWLYTGYSLDDIQIDTFQWLVLLYMVDVVVDGPFIEELKDISLEFRGSSNQRIIKTRRETYEDDKTWKKHAK